MERHDHSGIHQHFYYSDSAKEREAFLKKEFPSLQKYIYGKTVVDVGAGDGSVTRIIAEHAKKTYAIDVDKSSIDALRKNLGHIGSIYPKLATADRIPLRSGSVDAVFSSASFHHFPDGYINEITRILKANGVAIILDWKKHKAPLFMKQHHKLFSKKEVITLFEKTGFSELLVYDSSHYYMIVLQKESPAGEI